MAIYPPTHFNRWAEFFIEVRRSLEFISSKTRKSLNFFVHFLIAFQVFCCSVLEEAKTDFVYYILT